MIDSERFVIAKEEHGSFMRIYIPGKVPNHAGSRTIRWTGVPEPISGAVLKKEARRLKATLKSQGLLENLPQKTIPGYAHGYAYDCKLSMTGDITNDPRELIYIRNDVAYNMRHMLWYPLAEILKKEIQTHDYILVDIPVFPKVATEKFFQDWYDSNQKNAAFVQRLNRSSNHTQVCLTSSCGKTILKIKGHPFEKQPTRLVTLLPVPRTKTQPQLSETQLDNIRTRVLQRDVKYLKELTNFEQNQLSRASAPELADTYRLHWVQWLTLAGAAHRSNAIVVRPEIERSYQFTVQAPFMSFWERNKVDFAERGRPVLVELPVPLNAYRYKPAPQPMTNRQERRYLNRLTQQMAEICLTRED
ncbi:MAG: hypothetical protein IJV07_01110 [Alphaproteobacteria bacterium]|nr:hypothetical protein [Alphaproteobacteria bacterium]